MHLHVRVRSYVRMRVRAIVSVSIRVSMCKRTKTHVPTAIQVNGQTKNYRLSQARGRAKNAGVHAEIHTRTNLRPWCFQKPLEAFWLLTYIEIGRL
jgi:hypothetical protein